jgi:hypothetical protein
MKIDTQYRDAPESKPLALNPLLVADIASEQGEKAGDWLTKEGMDFIDEMFDTFLIGVPLSLLEIADNTARRHGDLWTRGQKAKAALAYLLAEGEATGEPQVRLVFGDKYQF